MEKYLEIKEGSDYRKLKSVAKVIKDGGIAVFPTETVYGIGTNGLDEEAVKRLYNVKHRPNEKPICLLVSSLDMVNEIAKDITDIEYRLMKAFFPGPFTIILKKRNVVPNIVTSDMETVGVRMPSDKIARSIIEYANVPIATSSANITGKASGTNIKDIIKDFGGKVDYIIDGGDSKLGIASTIVKVIDGIPHILRQGSITMEQIKSEIP